MGIKVDVINDYVRRLVSNLLTNLAFKNDFAKFSGSTPRYLLVEGTTDREFVKKIIRKDVSVMVADKAFMRRENNNGETVTDDKLNHKRAIIYAVYGLLNSQSNPLLISREQIKKNLSQKKLPPFFKEEKLPQFIEELNVYGMVDMDFDDPESEGLENTENLFVTDTHDLETLLLSTDPDLLPNLIKIEDDEIDNEIKIAFFVAYQLGILRSVLYDAPVRFDLGAISSGSTDVDYGALMQQNKDKKDYRISVNALVDYINEDEKNRLNKKNINEILSKAKKDKRVKKHLNNEGIWKTELDAFNWEDMEDFWRVVNGHEILAILRYINEDVKNAYADDTHPLNRKMEFALIKHYDYDKLANTKMYEKMQSAMIVLSSEEMVK